MGAMSRGRMMELTEVECWELLGSRPVGRVAFDDGDGPAIYPVNHTARDGRIRFRVSAYGVLARELGGRKVAFEVDDADEFHRSGWSVVVRGRATLVTAPTAWAEPAAWPEGVRSVMVEVVPTTVTGRRVLGS